MLFRSTNDAFRFDSDGEGTYTLADAEREKCGTTVTLYLRPAGEDGKDYTDEWTIRDIVKKYSDFIAWPIILNVSKVKAAAAFGVALVTDKTAPALVVGVAVAVFAAAARAGAMVAGFEITRVDTQRGMNFRPAAISGGFQVGQRVGGLILRFHGILPFR